MTFVSKVVAEGSTPAAELAAKLEAIGKKHFPKSNITGIFRTNLGVYIRVVFYLVGDKNKLPNGILENDPAMTTFFIYLSDANKDGSLPATMTIDINGTSASIYTKPEPGSNMALGLTKLGWRKKTGTEAELLNHFEAYMKKSKEIMKSVEDNLHGSAEQTAIYKEYINA